MDTSTKLSIAVLVVNSIAALFAVAAAIIAVVVYIKTARLQRQAINYSILESRIQIWKYFDFDRSQIESVVKRAIEGRDWQIEKFRLLFSEKLVEEYDAIITEGSALGDIAFQIDTIEREAFPFHADSNGKIDKTAYDLYSTILRERKRITEINPIESEWDAFRELCRSSFADRVSQDYFDTVKQYTERKIAGKKKNMEFIQHIENEIRASVKEAPKN